MIGLLALRPCYKESRRGTLRKRRPANSGGHYPHLRLSPDFLTAQPVASEVETQEMGSFRKITPMAREVISPRPHGGRLTARSAIHRKKRGTDDIVADRGSQRRAVVAGGPKMNPAKDAGV